MPTAWDFKLKADDAVLAAEEFGLAPDQASTSGRRRATSRRKTGA